MISVQYDPVELSLVISGHAGYAEHGKDIVCAGVSALFFAAYAELRARKFKFFAESDETVSSIKAYPNAEERHTCAVIFSTVVAGLENIAQQYPEYIQIKEEK